MGLSEEQKRIYNKLLLLEREQIAQIRNEYQRTHPQEASNVYLCNLALIEKGQQKNRSELEQMIDRYLENAPDGAATPDRANETR